MAKVTLNNSKTIFALAMNQAEAQTLLDLVRDVSGSVDTSRRKYIAAINGNLANLSLDNGGFLKISGTLGYKADDMVRDNLHFEDSPVDWSYEPLAQSFVKQDKYGKYSVHLQLNRFEAQAILDLTSSGVVCTGNYSTSRFKHVYNINYALRSQAYLGSQTRLKINITVKDIKGSMYFSDKVNTLPYDTPYSQKFYKPVKLESAHFSEPVIAPVCPKVEITISNGLAKPVPKEYTVERTDDCADFR